MHSTFGLEIGVDFSMAESCRNPNIAQRNLRRVLGLLHVRRYYLNQTPMPSSKTDTGRRESRAWAINLVCDDDASIWRRRGVELNNCKTGTTGMPIPPRSHQMSAITKRPSTSASSRNPPTQHPNGEANSSHRPRNYRDSTKFTCLTASLSCPVGVFGGAVHCGEQRTWRGAI